MRCFFLFCMVFFCVVGIRIEARVSQMMQPCPDVETFPNITVHLEDILGTWYEIKRSVFPTEAFLHCAKYDFNTFETPHGTKIQYRLTGIHRFVSRFEKFGTLNTTDVNNMKNFTFEFDDSHLVNYIHVLDMKKDKSLLLYSCRATQLTSHAFTQEHAWLLFRWPDVNLRDIREAESNLFPYTRMRPGAIWQTWFKNCEP
ncbi:uncharacterized protein LOC142337195 [Convolutriloba macropyga]|uniref:uncharacterized protein LOC142337195 n=1 Tax=Convolutriloba macropyga TaxID=536237 RepID=UPI003F525339